MVLKNHRYPNKPATSLDFIQELNTVTNFTHQSFINYWLKSTTVNDWKIEGVEVSTLTNDHFKVSVCVSDQFIETVQNNEVAASLTTPLYIDLDIGIFTEHPGNFYDKPIDQRTLAKGTLKMPNKNNAKKSGVCAEYEVAHKPTFVEVDPYYQTLDQHRENNLIRINEKDEINE
jgi:hypothetical protein